MVSAWATLRAEQLDELNEDHKLRYAVMNGEVGDMLAVFDRQDLTTESWRKVILECIESELLTTRWVLKSENGELLDKPGRIALRRASARILFY